MAFVSGAETLIVQGCWQSPDGEPARGYIDVQLTQPTADQNINVIYTQKSMRYQLDGNGAVEIELIKTGSTVSDPVALSRSVGITISENFEGCKVKKWSTVIDTTANQEEGIFQLADAAETVARPLNQYVLLGTYSASLFAKMDKTGGTFTGPVTFGGTVAGLTKSSVGLSNVDNTSDANKPISSATQSALNAKADNVLTGYTSGAGTVASTDTVLQAIQKLNGNDAAKAPIANPSFTNSFRRSVQNVTGATTLTTTSPPTIVCTGTAPYTITMPSTGTNAGYEFTIKNNTTGIVSTNSISVNGTTAVQNIAAGGVLKVVSLSTSNTWASL